MSVPPVQVRYDRGDVVVRIPVIRTTYLDAAMRADCFPEIWDLFRRAHAPAKELTESYAALRKLRAWHDRPRHVLHVGDGAHARTAALFAFFTRHRNLAIDPALDAGRRHVVDWETRYEVRRFEWLPLRVEEYSIEAYARRWGYGEAPILLTFVHAHVDTDAVLDRLPAGSWAAAYVCACCHPREQLSRGHRVVEEGEDWAVLSPERRYQVIVPREVDGSDVYPPRILP